MPRSISESNNNKYLSPRAANNNLLLPGGLMRAEAHTRGARLSDWLIMR